MNDLIKFELVDLSVIADIELNSVPHCSGCGGSGGGCNGGGCGKNNGNCRPTTPEQAQL